MERTMAYLSLGETNELDKTTVTTVPVKSTVPSGQIYESWSELKAAKVEFNIPCHSES